MNKKILIAGFAALLVVGGIGYSIFGQSETSSSAPSSFKGSLGDIRMNLGTPNVQSANAQVNRENNIRSFNSMMNSSDFRARYKAGTTLLGNTICFNGTNYYQELTQHVNELDAIVTRLRVNSQTVAAFDRERATISNDLSSLGYRLSMIGGIADMAAANQCTRHIPATVMDYLFGGVLRRNAAVYMSDLNELNRLYNAAR